MKSLLAIAFSFLTFFCNGQIQRNSDASYNLAITYRPAVINILTDTGTFSSSTVNSDIHRMIFTHMTPGTYKILICGQGQTSVVRDSIFVQKGQNLLLNLTFSGPCLCDHPANYIPTCPKNHTDNIIPIVYGLVVMGDSLAKKNKDMKVKFGGCVVTDCDPRFYCREHDIKF